MVIIKVDSVNNALQYTCAHLVDEQLPEGVRVLSVFLHTDEYDDLVQRCSSSHVQQLNRSSTVQQVQHSDSVNTKSQTVGVGISDGSGGAEDSRKQTYTEDCAKMLAKRDNRPSIQQQGGCAETPDTAAVFESSAISGEMSVQICRPCDDVASAETSDSAVTAGTRSRVVQSSTTLTRLSSVNSDTASTAAVCVHGASDDGNELRPLELYIQGNSQTVFLLFVQQGSLSELDVIRDLVCNASCIFIFFMFIRSPAVRMETLYFPIVLMPIHLSLIHI